MPVMGDPEPEIGVRGWLARVTTPGAEKRTESARKAAVQLNCESCGHDGIGRHKGLSHLSALGEPQGAELLKFRETFHMAIQSQAFRPNSRAKV